MTTKEAKELLVHVLMTYEPRDQYGDWDDSEPYEEAITMAIEALSEQKTGKWYDVGVSARCDQCGCKNNKPTRYCPNCGAKMVREDGEA